MSQKRIYRKIASAKAEKSLVEFTNKLKVANISEFSRIMDEKSKIGIVVQDYSNGTGENNIIVEANILPEEAQELFERAKGISYFGCKGEFYKSWTKIFGEYADENGKKDGNSIVSKLTISRNPVASDGKPKRYPWTIYIENGKGKMDAEHNALVPNTYVCIKKARKLVSDEEFILLLRRVDSCIREFEHMAATELFASAYKKQAAENNEFKKSK